MTWLFIIVLVDAMGFGIILPLLPLFALKFDLTPLHLGVLTSSFAFFQLISSPILGILSDRLGRKYVIITCMFCLGISYYLLAAATTFKEALMARALAGIFTGNIAVALAATADLSCNIKRTKYMGIIGAANGLGFMLGPILGGLLAGHEAANADLSFVLQVSSTITITTAILALFFFRETLPKNTRYNFNLKNKISRTLVLISHNKNMLFLIYLSVLMWFSFAALEVFLITWAVNKFNITPFYLGVAITALSFVVAFVQVFSPRYIDGGKAILLGFQLSALSVLILLFNPALPMLIFLLFPLAVGMGILYPNLNAKISIYSYKSQRGFILGLSQSASTIGQALGPLIVGFAYYKSSPTLAWIIVGGVFMISSFVALFYMLGEKNHLSEQQ